MLAPAGAEIVFKVIDVTVCCMPVTHRTLELPARVYCFNITLERLSPLLYCTSKAFATSDARPASWSTICFSYHIAN